MVVEVKPPQTVEQISVNHQGKFDKKPIQETNPFNPQIKYINRVETRERTVPTGRIPTSPGAGLGGRVDIEPTTSERN